uniref:Sucrose transporter 1 n=1 Tax=Ginkgo biloba TaxID=3311 RepID=A0A3G4RXV2_GINBI|nr:sucrose transporter 1 [Ginkgo biloba]|eukprot:Gb_03808 [translate_table: standard]
MDRNLRMGRRVKHEVPLRTVARVASVATGVQFGWALQLSLLTPYVQVLGIPHTWASYIWLCGPISGMLVQPIVGYYSDRCDSQWGRRRPFIVIGSCFVVCAVLLIGFSEDLGYLFGDSHTSRPRAIIVFILGFWILDLANNLLQGPCRALLADLTGRNQRRTRSANALFSLFMAVGNVLGFAAGSYSKWYKLLPFTRTVACDVNCANLKSAFFIAIIVTITATILSISSVPERRWSPLSERKPIIPAPCASAPQDAKAEAIAKAGDVQDDDDEELSEAFIWELFTAFWDLPHSMWYLLLVTALTWIAWFPFLLFDTDWMGREVYRGEPSGHSAFSSLYDQGVRAGAFGLMLNAIMLGATSLMVDFLAGKFGPRLLWAMANLILSVSLACTGLITKAAEVYTNEPSSPPAAVKISAMVLFSVLGVPLAVTYSIPFALAATFSSSSGAGQGLSMGVLNLSVVIPQIFVSLGSGPWDALFGGGNLPAFMLASVSALAGAIAILTWLPSPPPDFPSSHILRTQSSPFP